MLKLDLCSGTAAPIRKTQGFVTLDVRPFPGVDYVLELGKDHLPFEDDSVMGIRAHDALEHIREGFFELMDECWRVMHPQGVFDIFVPRFPSASAVMHQDHSRYFIGEEDARPFAQALLDLTGGKVSQLFCVHTWSMFLPPADGVDPHGYLKGFWHLVSQREVDTHLYVKLSPNKPHGRYPYKEVTNVAGRP